MTEKLIIKNFGPVKDAEIDLKKVNIFIGPQGSGKSIIAKVVSSIQSYRDWENGTWIFNDLKSKLEGYFNLATFFEPDTQINIETIEGNKIELTHNSSGLTPLKEDSSFSEAIYVPAERILIPLITESSFFFIGERTPIPKYIADFGLLFQKARNVIRTQKIGALDDITYHFEQGRDIIELVNGKKILLTESSTGIQSTVPFLIILSWLASDKYKKVDGKSVSISLEEQELSIYPYTQNDVLKFIFEKLAYINYHLTITTHSPYTLTAINNLIYAYLVGKQNAAAKEIVPEELWLNPDDVGAWIVEKGTVRSIIDNESKQIRADEIDKISEVIGDSMENLAKIKMEGK